MQNVARGSKHMAQRFKGRRAPVSGGMLKSILRRGTKWGGQDLREQELQGERLEGGSWLPSNCHLFIFPHLILP